MKINDVALGVLLMGFGLWVTLTAMSFPTMSGQFVGPGTFPKVIGALMALGGLGIALGSQHRRAPLLDLSESWQERRAVASVLVALLGTLVFAIWFEKIGFPLGASALLCALFLATGRARLPWMLLAIGFTLAVYLMMTRLLHVPLPVGPLKGIL